MASLGLPFHDKENTSTSNIGFGKSERLKTSKLVNPSRSVKKAHQSVNSLSRRALGNVSNITPSVKDDYHYGQRKGGSIQIKKPATVLSGSGKKVRKVPKPISGKLEGVSPAVLSTPNSVQNEDYAEIEYMPVYPEPEDNYEDILPLNERLTIKELEWLKDWKPKCASRACSPSPRPTPVPVEPVAQWLAIAFYITVLVPDVRLELSDDRSEPCSILPILYPGLVHWM
ncbi:uncharacterized protein LOC143229065 isoform X3 [Tachypleus tridentatus]|uniref:uncharacterized protein LOC143229065 isoform X3 n=1 Tax=Tachypleus tridentatus TaxID=6853 RepID=UPI003FD39827